MRLQLAAGTVASSHRSDSAKAVSVDGASFTLQGHNVTYRFHVDEASGDLISDHFGGSAPGLTPPPSLARMGGWTEHSRARRELPDTGRGDFRSPAIRIRSATGHAISQFQYVSHTIVDGKECLEGLPSTFGSGSAAQTLIVHMRDSRSCIVADLYYTIFPEHDAVVRSVKLINNGSDQVVVEKLTSFSFDFPAAEYDMLGLRGEWTRECTKMRRHVDFGTQGFSSTTGFSSHNHNPFMALASPDTSEHDGEVWGFSLIYSGSFNAEAERSPHGHVRALLGLNEHQLSWPLNPGDNFTSPECVAIYSSEGVGGMSRRFHNLFRKHLIRSTFVTKSRPALLNDWEGVYFDFDEHKILQMAEATANLGIKLFVMDDGWFGNKYPRVDDHAGLGDWVPNPDRFPNGLRPMVDAATQFPVAGSDKKLQFGIWVEPEMVNPKSALFEQHPDWALHAGDYPLTEARYQLVLNLSLPAVQDYIINAISRVLESAPITYVKWDHNRGIHEVPTPSTYHAYMIGLYHVLDALTTKFPHVLWEGCASGGGRFDPGMLPYFPQSWTSDNTCPVDRIAIQFGTTTMYPASAMGCHVSHCPNDTTKRVTSLSFRAHVAMMGGSFGLELDPTKVSAQDRDQIPALLKLAEKVNPVVINGQMWKLALPDECQRPAALYVSDDGKQVVLFAFQMLATTVIGFPVLKLRGLEAEATYTVDGGEVYKGRTLMNVGLSIDFVGDYDSRVVMLQKM